jgi:hypothetical protein
MTSIVSVPGQVLETQPDRRALAISSSWASWTRGALDRAPASRSRHHSAALDERLGLVGARPAAGSSLRSTSSTGPDLHCASCSLDLTAPQHQAPIVT